MRTQSPSPPEPFYLTFSRKAVLLLLLMITSAIALVALLLQARVSIPVLAFILSDALVGLVAGFSVRRILPRKAPVLRIGSAVTFIVGALALLGWFTGWAFGIDLFRAGHIRVNWWELGQTLLATGFSLLALYAWQRPARTVIPVSTIKAMQKVPRARRKVQKRSNHPQKLQPASPVTSQAIQPSSQEVATQPAKPKRKRIDHSKPKLLLSNQVEHRCPYCLELVEPGDLRGVVECEICHTLHHADCWAITGACQVPHFTS